MNAVILSNALDTNGQNARYVKAAEKHGTDERVISAFAIGPADPGNVVYRLQQAAEKSQGLRIRSAHKAMPYFDFPRDILWTRHTDAEVRELATAADVIHLNNSWIAADRLRLRKPALLHHHGSLFRNNPDKMLTVARHRRYVQAVSTIDLLRYAPDELHWLPTAYDIDALQARRQKRKSDKVRIVHAPTNRALKATDHFIRVTDALIKDGLPIEVILVEGKTWAETMEVKATADILFDQIAFGYGCNAVEAWGMGIPVISGGDEWTEAEMVRRWGALPYKQATEATLKDVIVEMLQPNARQEYAERGLAHVRAYHDEKPALAILADLYAKAIRGFDTPVRKPVPAVTFRNTSGKHVYDVLGKKLEWTDGLTQVTDPLMVDRLRALAQRRPAYGISEVQP